MLKHLSFKIFKLENNIEFQECPVKLTVFQIFYYSINSSQFNGKIYLMQYTEFFIIVY